MIGFSRPYEYFLILKSRFGLNKAKAVFLMGLFQSMMCPEKVYDNGLGFHRGHPLAFTMMRRFATMLSPRSSPGLVT